MDRDTKLSFRVSKPNVNNNVIKVKRKDAVNDTKKVLNETKKQLLRSVRERLSNLTSLGKLVNVSKEIVKESPLSKSEDSYYKLRDTEINQNEFQFMISGRTICKDSNQPFLVILIMSVHTHIDTREAIRNTWASVAKSGTWPLIGAVKEKVKLVFLFGKGRSDLKDSIVEQESKIYGDIVQADFVDSYFNLTRKILTGIRWVSLFCPKVKFILKADEDVFVHIPNLIKVLKDRPAKKEGMIYGHTHGNATVLRTGRWAVRKEDFPFEAYPTYACGNTYVISGNTIASIYSSSKFLPFLNIEDVFVTGIARKSLRVPISDIPGFTHWYEKKPKPCEFKNTKRISATKVDDNLQFAIWAGLKDKSLKDCYKPEKTKVVNRPENIFRNMNNNFRDDHIFYNSSSGNFYVVK